MKKVLFLLASIMVTVSFSQSYIGFLNDNYSGVHTVIKNPANIVDSRYKADINLFSFSTFLSNDYASIDIWKKLKNKDLKFDEYSKTFLSNNNNGNNYTDILGPSFMFNITPKHSVALFTRLRSVIGANNIDGNVAEVFRNEFVSTDIFNTNIENANASGSIWSEIGVSYATILLDKKEHFLKGGLSLKYLSGLAVVNGNITNAKIEYDTKNDTDVNNNEIKVNGELNYSYSDVFNNENLDTEDILKKFSESKGSGFAADLGFTYEWRPNADKYTYSNQEGKSIYYKDVNKYKLRLGLSVTDLGSVNFKNAITETYKVNRTIRKDDIDNLPKNKSEALKKLFGNPIKSETEVSGSLPTAIHFNADWNIYKKFYVNLDTNFDIASNEGVKIENTYSLTPRFETKWLSVNVPLSIYSNSGFNAGFGLRAGPLFFGSGTILSNLFNDKSKAADVYFGLKIPIYQSRPKDRNGDGIFDKVDNCPKEAGPIENNGCPWGDKDEDGITDNIDKCPDVAGSEELEGCPDSDGDGVRDSEDKCPEVAGDKNFGGCPADTDGDGIRDSEDKCPKIPGEKEFSGCPADTDGDGVFDTADKCPKVAGSKDNNGCPGEPKKVVVITKEAKKTIDSYARAIYFNSGKTTFKPGVTEKLDMIIAVMNQYPDSNFSVEGHTDSQGKATSNQSLSDRRAKAVLNYMVRQGISPSRLSSYGFGEEHPIDSNKTRAGRANNRRVEIKLKK